MQLKQLFHMLRAATPDEPAPKAVPKGAGGTFAAVLSGTLDADALQDAPRQVRQALHGRVRQAAAGKGGSPVEGLPDGLPDALRHSLEALLKTASADPATGGAAEGPADGTAPDAPRLVLKADGTVHLQLPNDGTTAKGDTDRPSSGRAPGDAPRYTQPGGPKGQNPAVPADHRVRQPKGQKGQGANNAGRQPASSAGGNAQNTAASQTPRPATPPDAAPTADRPTAPDLPTKSAPAPKLMPSSATTAVQEAITRLAAEGQAAADEAKAKTQDAPTDEAKTQRTAAEGGQNQRTGGELTQSRGVVHTEPGTVEARQQLQSEVKTERATPRSGVPASTASAASPASTVSTPFPTEAAPVLYPGEETLAKNGDAKTAEPTPKPADGMALPTVDTAGSPEEGLTTKANPSTERPLQAQAPSTAGEKAEARTVPAVDPRPSNPPTPEKPAPNLNGPAPRQPAPAAAPTAEVLPDDASADVRLEAGAQARTEQTATARTDGGGLALRMDGDAPLQPRPGAPALAAADAAPASSTSADGGTADQGSDSDPQQRHRDAQALQQALRLARQTGAAAPPVAPLASADFNQSLSEALATLPSDTPAVTTTDDADGEAQLLRHALEGVLSEVKSSRTTPTGRTAAPGASQANMNAWMKTLMNQPARAFALNNGWQVLQVQLEDGQGSLTVSARRDDDSMAVSVGFTDPALRGQAAAHAGRIQDALQAQYQTQVDFSLHDDTQERSSHDRSNPSRTAASLQGTDAEPDAPSSAASSSVRAALLGANHEWIA